MNIILIQKEDADRIAPLLPEEVTKSLKEGMPVTVFAAIEDDLAVGTIAGAVDGDTFELISIYVHPDYRRRGIGEALIQRLDELLEGENLPVRAEYTLQDPEGDELQSLDYFLRIQGFTEEEEKLPCWFMGQVRDLKTKPNPAKEPFEDLLPPEELIRQQLLKEDRIREKEEEEKIRAFQEVPEKTLKAAAAEAQSHGAPVPEGGLISPSVDSKISSCVLEEGKVRAYLTAEVLSEDLIKISALYSALPDPRDLMSMIDRTAGELTERYKPEMRIAMLALNRTSEKLIRYMFDRPVNCTRRFYRL